MSIRTTLLAFSATGLLLGCTPLNLPERADVVLAPVEADWTTLPTQAFRGKRDDIAFADSEHGWYGTGAGELFRTVDGGQSWEQVAKREGTFIRAVAFLDPMNGFIGNIGTDYYPGVTDTVPLYRTRDGGRTWEPVDTGEATIAGVCAIDVLRTDRIFQGQTVARTVIHAAGRVGGPPGILRSVDGGDSWSVIDLSDRIGMILDVKFFDENTGLVFAASERSSANAQGVVLMTRDGGQTWSEVYRSGRARELIWKADFPTRDIGYATVQSYDPQRAQQLVIKTTDGGATWTELPMTQNAKARQFGIGFADAQTGFVGTMDGGYETRDGGLTWSRSNLAPAANNFAKVAEGDEVQLFAIGTEVQRRTFRAAP